MDDTVKLTSINVVLGIIAGVLSGIFTIGMLGIKNDMIGLLIGIIFVAIIVLVMVLAFGSAVNSYSSVDPFAYSSSSYYY